MDEQQNIAGVHNHCPGCGRCNKIFIDAKALYQWRVLNIPIQLALKEYSDTTREMILSGYCPGCQRDIFDEEQELVSHGT